jgi:hypothetical protein
MRLFIEKSISDLQNVFETEDNNDKILKQSSIKNFKIIKKIFLTVGTYSVLESQTESNNQDDSPNNFILDDGKLWSYNMSGLNNTKKSRVGKLKSFKG